MRSCHLKTLSVVMQKLKWTGQSLIYSAPNRYNNESVFLSKHVSGDRTVQLDNFDLLTISVAQLMLVWSCKGLEPSRILCKQRDDGTLADVYFRSKSPAHN